MIKHKRQLQRSNNPNNPSCSPIIQCLLDMQQVGFPLEPIEQLLESINNNNNKLQKAEQIFKEHQYPDNRTTFFQGNRDIELTCFLSSNELKILYLMIQVMRKGNLVELSISDIKEYLNIADKTATKALNELKNKGCIAVQFNRNKTRGTVYMINPTIAIVGNVKKNDLQAIFWNLTGSKFDNKDYIKSEPHQKWLSLTKELKYSKGYDCQVHNNTTFYFNKINEPDTINTTKKKDSPDWQSGESKTKHRTL